MANIGCLYNHRLLFSTTYTKWFMSTVQRFMLNAIHQSGSGVIVIVASSHRIRLLKININRHHRIVAHFDTYAINIWVYTNSMLIPGGVKMMYEAEDISFNRCFGFCYVI